MTPEWRPGADPFPPEKIRKITALKYTGELQFVRHAKVHLDKPPRSLWQLSADFGLTIKVHPEGGSAYSREITAPRGLYTDLASVPKMLWSFAGPIGRHLEISIIHDYLYMKWTDDRLDNQRFCDWGRA